MIDKNTVKSKIWYRALKVIWLLLIVSTLIISVIMCWWDWSLMVMVLWFVLLINNLIIRWFWYIAIGTTNPDKEDFDVHLFKTFLPVILIICWLLFSWIWNSIEDYRWEKQQQKYEKLEEDKKKLKETQNNSPKEYRDFKGLSLKYPWYLSLDDYRDTKAAPPILTEKDIRRLKNFDLIHSGCYAGVEGEMKKLKDVESLITFDFSVEPEFKETEYLKKICPYIDMALFSCEGMEPAEIHELQEKVYQMGTSYVLATNGTKGQILYDGATYYDGVVELVEAVDTMGAGDSFFTSFVISDSIFNIPIF